VKNKIFTVTLGAALALSIGVSPVSADMASGDIMANTCYSCHGTDGVSAGAMPTISGKSQKFIATNMKAFRSDKRKGTVMNRIAKGFTEAEIDALSKIFGK
jgi:cytochrome subunit of sulfide dehydrogenase